MSVRSRLDVKKSLIRRAFNEHRSELVRNEILRRMAKIRSWADEDRDALANFLQQNEEQGRAIRALNIIGEKHGKRFTEKAGVMISEKDRYSSNRDYSQDPADVGKSSKSLSSIVAVLADRMIGNTDTINLVGLIPPGQA